MQNTRNAAVLAGLLLAMTACKHYDETLSNDLVAAAADKDVEKTRGLLARNANPNAVDAEGAPLLMTVLQRMKISFQELSSGVIGDGAQTSETEQIVKLLLDAGANPNGRNKEGNPVLLAALARQDPAIVEDLIRAGASVRETSSSGWPMIVHAAYAGNQKIVQLLLDSGANVNETGKDGATALLAATNKHHAELRAC
ncbi:MAG: ankyrin repeat domain-containing protein [Bryobacteraceae bacterium]